MAKLKSYNATDNTPATINKMYQNVAAALADIPEPSTTLGIQPIQSTASVNSYTVNKSDVFLVVNALGGPMKIVLPVPSRQRQSVHILNANITKNIVSIVQSNGAAMGSGAAVVDLASGASALMVCDGTAWWQF